MYPTFGHLNLQLGPIALPSKGNSVEARDLTIKQTDLESFHDALEMFKHMIKKCHNH